MAYSALCAAQQLGVAARRLRNVQSVQRGIRRNRRVVNEEAVQRAMNNYPAAMATLGDSGSPTYCSIGLFSEQFSMVFSQLRGVGNVRHKFRQSGTGTNQDEVYTREYKQTVRHVRGFQVTSEFREGRPVPTCLQNPYLVFASGRPLPADPGVAAAIPQPGRPDHVSREYHGSRDDGRDMPQLVEDSEHSDESEGEETSSTARLRESEREAMSVEETQDEDSESGSQTSSSSSRTSRSSRSTSSSKSSGSRSASQSSRSSSNASYLSDAPARRDSTDTELTRAFQDAMAPETHSAGSFKVSVSRHGKRRIRRAVSSSPEDTRRRDRDDEARITRKAERQERRESKRGKENDRGRRSVTPAPTRRRRHASNRRYPEERQLDSRQESEVRKSKDRGDRRDREPSPSKGRRRESARESSSKRQSRRDAPQDESHRRSKSAAPRDTRKEASKDMSVRPKTSSSSTGKRRGETEPRDNFDIREAQREYERLEERRQRDLERQQRLEKVRREYEAECRRRDQERQQRHKQRGLTSADLGYAPVPDKDDLRYYLNERKKVDAKPEKVERPKTPAPVSASKQAPTPKPKMQMLPMGAAPGEGKLLPAPPPKSRQEQANAKYSQYTLLARKAPENYVDSRPLLKRSHPAKPNSSATPTSSPQQKSPKLPAKVREWDPLLDYPKGPQIIPRKECVQNSLALREWNARTMDFSGYANEIRCLAVYGESGPKMAMEIIVMMHTALYQKALGVDYPEPVIPAWLNQQKARPIGTLPPMPREPYSPSGRSTPEKVNAALWAGICSKLQYDFDAESYQSTETPYGGFARNHSRLALYVYYRIGIILGRDLTPPFEEILANTPWASFWNRLTSAEQIKIKRQQCCVGGLAEQCSTANLDVAIVVRTRARKDYRVIEKEVQGGLRRDKSGPLGVPVIDITGTSPQARAIVAAKVNANPAPRSQPSRPATPPATPKARTKTALEEELGSPVKTIADKYINETMGLECSESEDENMETETSTVQETTMEVQVASVTTVQVPNFDLQPLETEKAIASITGLPELSPYVTGNPGDDILTGDIAGEDLPKEEEDRLLMEAAKTATGMRSFDQNKAPGNNRPVSGRH